MEKLRTHSPSLPERNVDKIAELFPGVVTEGRDADGAAIRAVDFDLLRQELAGQVVEGPSERYQLDWPGKREALFTANAPVAKTLRPDRAASVGFDTTRNIFIEGDNLDALKLLQKSYLNKIRLIYIDPPYNTGRLVANTESNGRFHSDWLSMMYPRLKLARNLLADDGAIFVSIDATEHANLTRLLTELMGEDNFRANIVWQKRYTRSNNTRDFTAVVENVIVFSRGDQFTVNLLPRTEEADARYANPDGDPRGPWKAASFLNPASPAQRPSLCYEIRNPNTGQVTRPTARAWRRTRAEFDRLAADDLLYWGADGRSPVPSVKVFLAEARGLTPTNFWSHEYAGHTDEGTRDLAALIGGKVFDNPKPVKLMKRVLEHATDGSSLVLDFFAGTGTMAQAVLELNAEDGGARRFIAVQAAEECAPRSAAAKAGFATIADVCRERIRRAGAAVRAERGSLRADDTGFRVLKVETVHGGRTAEDLLFEVMLGCGVDLGSPVAAEPVDGRAVFLVDDGALIACLAGDISPAVVRDIARRGPSRAVFLDSGFATDADRIDADRIFARVSPGTEVRVI